MDFAEETLKLEHLAVRFKHEETLKEFKKVFENCQEDLRLNGGSPSKPAVTFYTITVGETTSIELYVKLT